MFNNRHSLGVEHGLTIEGHLLDVGFEIFNTLEVRFILHAYAQDWGFFIIKGIFWDP
mgnify:CR=1 FL=1